MTENNELIELLEEMLQEAKEGKLLALAYMAISDGNIPTWGVCGKLDSTDATFLLGSGCQVERDLLNFIDAQPDAMEAAPGAH
jgi:hypothetical protein